MVLQPIIWTLETLIMSIMSEVLTEGSVPRRVSGGCH